jgi:hypothetical protein
MRLSHVTPFVIAATMIACRDGPAAMPSSPSPATPPVAGTVSGTVFEHTMSGYRPLAGLPLSVRMWRPPGSIQIVTSDQNGRYEASGIAVRDTVTVAPVMDSDYRAPCPPGVDVFGTTGTFDVHVVSTALLATEGAPSSLPRSVIWVRGSVIGLTQQGLQPMTGASVELAATDSDAFVMSSTVTDRSGRYLLCTAPPGVGTDQLGWVRVRKEGYRLASRSILLGLNSLLDIELERQ